MKRLFWIQFLLRNDATREEMGVRGQRLISGFHSYDLRVLKVLSTMDDVLALRQPISPPGGSAAESCGASHGNYYYVRSHPLQTSSLTTAPSTGGRVRREQNGLSSKVDFMADRDTGVGGDNRLPSSPCSSAVASANINPVRPNSASLLLLYSTTTPPSPLLRHNLQQAAVQVSGGVRLQYVEVNDNGTFNTSYERDDSSATLDNIGRFGVGHRRHDGTTRDWVGAQGASQVQGSTEHKAAAGSSSVSLNGCVIEKNENTQEKAGDDVDCDRLSLLRGVDRHHHAAADGSDLGVFVGEKSCGNLVTGTKGIEVVSWFCDRSMFNLVLVYAAVSQDEPTPRRTSPSKSSGMYRNRALVDCLARTHVNSLLYNILSCLP